MFEYIKQPYTSPVEGVTNTRTGWKLTSDPEGLVILEEAELSADNLNRYASNIIVPSGSKIYVWYKLELSTGEIKNYVGPIEFISREDNITSELKPITRVKTPSILWNDNNLQSGNTTIILISSEFIGDKLDGHLATTWMFKNPNGDIIHHVPFSTADKYELGVDRTVLGLNMYPYITGYIKHHSSNGATSDFGKIDIPMSVYPFMFIGDKVLNSRIDYQFTITPFDPLLPNISEIRVVDKVTNIVKLTFTDMNTLQFIIPAYTLDQNKRYVIQCFVADTDGGTYPVKMDVVIDSKFISNVVHYSNLYDYDISTITAVADTSVTSTHKVLDRLVSDKMISYDVGISEFKLHIFNSITEQLEVLILTHTAEVTAIMNTVDFKLFNLSTGKLIVVTRTADTIYINRLYLSGTIIKLDTTFTTMINITTDTNHNLANTTAISEDEKYVYYMAIKSTHIELASANLSTGTYSVLMNREDITSLSYDPTTMVLCSIADKKFISFGGTGDLWHYYNIDDGQWTVMGLLPSEFMLDITAIYRAIVLADRSVLLCSDYGTPKQVFRIKPNMTIEEVELNISLRDYNIINIDNAGVVFGYSNSLLSRIKLIPNKSM